jgi:hypothetical protein
MTDQTSAASAGGGIIRRLTKLEVLYDDELHHNNLISTRAFLIHLAEGHRIDARLLREACGYWLRHNPFLCAQIQRGASKSETERYFVRMDLAELLKLANVELVETDHYFKWVERMDKEIVTPFDMTRGPLWRLTLVRIVNSDPFGVTNNCKPPSSSSSSGSDYNYVFLLSTQNTLGDEPSVFNFFSQLMNILVALLEKKRCPEMDDLSRLPVVVREADSAVPRMRRFQVKQDVNIRLKRSSALFADSDLNGRFNLNRFSALLSEADLLSMRHNTSGTQQKDFNVQLSSFDSKNRVSEMLANKYDDACGRFKQFYLDSNRLKRLIVTTRLNAKNANLTSVLSTILCLAFKNLYSKYKVNDIPTNKFQYHILANLRDKLQVPKSQIGAYTTVLESTTCSRDLSLGSFWQIVESHSALMERKLNENKDINFLSDVDRLYRQIKAEQYTEKNVNFTVSNASHLRNGDRRLIRIKQHYVRMPCVCGRFGSNFFVALTIVDGKLCWSFSYSESHLSTNVVNELIGDISAIIRALIATI